MERRQNKGLQNVFPPQVLIPKLLEGIVAVFKELHHDLRTSFAADLFEIETMLIGG